MPRVIVKRGRANPLWHGHPWLYSGAVEREEGRGEPGGIVEVSDADGRFIGRGFANPRSQIRVRLVTWRDEPVDGALIARRLDEAARIRRRLGLPGSETNAFRWVNAEGDGLPGLVVDRYAEVAAVQFTALGMKRLEGEVFDALAATEPRLHLEVARSYVERERLFVTLCYDRYRIRLRKARQVPKIRVLTELEFGVVTAHLLVCRRNDRHRAVIHLLDEPF